MAKHRSMDDYGKEAEDNPKGFIFKLTLFIFTIVVFISILGYAGSWFFEAGEVAREQFGPRAMMKKYEWFKDSSAQLDSKLATIEAYKVRTQSMDETYEGTPRVKWPRSDREQYNQWRSEVAGVITSFNNLAAEYNSQMSKFNYRFTEAGDVPDGAVIPLPREFKPYQVN